MDFSQLVQAKCKELGTKLSDNELKECFDGSPQGRIRIHYLSWIGDLNEIIDTINIILIDLSDLRNNKASLKGNPVVRSEFLFRSFFSEFFRIRETSKLFFKILVKEGILNNELKKMITEFFYTAFDYCYKIRNSIVHEGAVINNYKMVTEASVFKELSKEEKLKFQALIDEDNTRENTVEIQVTFYIYCIKNIMITFAEFQPILDKVLAELIEGYEKQVNITVEKVNG